MCVCACGSMRMCPCVHATRQRPTFFLPNLVVVRDVNPQWDPRAPECHHVQRGKIRTAIVQKCKSAKTYKSDLDLCSPLVSAVHQLHTRSFTHCRVKHRSHTHTHTYIRTHEHSQLACQVPSHTHTHTHTGESGPFQTPDPMVTRAAGPPPRPRAP